MENLKIEQYRVPIVYVYNSDDECIGNFNNDHECNKFVIKMLENNVTDKYYFMWQGVKITVNHLGELSSWPLGMYDETQRDYSKLIQLIKEILNKNK